MDWLTANAGVLLNGVATGLLLFCMAIGLTLIFGLMDVLNLAHGATFLLGAYVAYRIAGETVSSWPGFLLAVAVAAAGGAALGALLTVMVRPLLRRGHLDQALLTLGLAVVLGELLQVVFGREDHAVAPPPGLGGSVALFGGEYPVYRLFVIGVGAAVALGVWWVIERTPAGAVIRATVADREIARVVGLDAGRITLAVFVGASMLATVGGVLAGPVRGAAPGLDDEFLILALVVVVIGGIGSIAGTLAGSLLIGLVQNLGVALFPEAASFLLFGAMALVIVVRPRGLLTSAAAP